MTATIDKRGLRTQALERKERILDALQRWPELKYSALAKRLGIKTGTLFYDLHQLRKAGRIAPRQRSKNEFDVAKRRRKVLDLLCENPNITAREIAGIINEPLVAVTQDKYLLVKAGIAPKGVRSRRRANAALSDELLKRVVKADDASLSMDELARDLGVKGAVIKQARQVIALKSGRGLDRDFEAERDFRRRQLEYHPNTTMTSKKRPCEGLLGVRLPEEEHKRWMKLHKLKRQGLSWREEGVYRTRGHGVKKTQYAFENVLQIRKRMRERSLVTELKGKGYRFNKGWKS
ncbi:MAG: hypothetical protein IJL92_04520 [Thermoguttaceae bacterium]|nr:hypothetical protein [Thermoguttaceae bacterium]